MNQHSILIAEDEILFAKVLQEAFKEKGFTVYGADNGLSALKQYHTCKPDVIVMDIDMPEKDGWEVLSQIRENDKWIPVIIMTGRQSDKIDSVESYKKGADYFIRKPFNLQEIIELVDFVIQKAYGKAGSLAFGNCRLNLSSRLLQTGSGEQHLTEREATILYLLIKKSNKIVTIREFQEYIWRDTFPSNHQMVKNIITKLKKMLKEDKTTRIDAIYGAGYMLCLNFAYKK
ncbi:DNA-binding response regulator [Bacteroidia bacterium]|nr:DNA-binding response regulator [Bacteroidia bacterium]